MAFNWLILTILLIFKKFNRIGIFYWNFRIHCIFGYICWWII